MTVDATQINILKTASDWARAEIFSSAFFALFGLLFILSSICFWQFGKTPTAKAYVIPLLVAGGLLIVIGVGLVISNQMRLSDFSAAYSADAVGFVASEIARADKTISGYETAVFRVIPVIVVISAGLVLFMRTPVWSASLITIIAMMAVILLVDTNASARMEAYREKLLVEQQQS